MRSTFVLLRKLSGLLIFFSILSMAFPVFAARVAAVKGRKVLILGNVQKGKLYYVSVKGKKRGIIKVVKVKGNKALAALLKGRAGKGYSLSLRPSKRKKSKSSYSNYSYNSSGSGTKLKKDVSIGGLVGLVQSGANVTFDDGTDVSLSGSAVGFKAFGDYGLNKNFSLRGMVGTQPFEASEGGQNCTLVNCQMSINYLSADMWARYFINPQSTMRIWLGAGLGLLFPLDTGNTNAVVPSDIGSTMVFQAAGGIDWFFGEKYFIPLNIEYNLIPPSESVSTQMLSFRAGLGIRL